MGRLFLSYAREDVVAAKAFAGELERAGHEVWWDHQLRAGSRFSWDIATALKDAEAVVVLWSKDSIESAWVQDEAAEGLEGSRLVPVSLDNSKPPLGFRQYHTVDMSEWRGGAPVFKQLTGAIEATIGGTKISAAPPRGETAASQCAICVMQFANKSGDPAQDYFSDGITEDVITDLSKISALSVIGHNTGAADLQQLASERGVTHVIEGTVRKSGGQLRITAQLIETASARNLWAERFDRELSDVFAIQDEISHAIVEALQLKLLPAEKRALAEDRTTSAEAYDLYLRARGLWPAAVCGDYRKGQEIVRFCSGATAIDPDYANAWSLIALASAELRFWQTAGIDAIAPAERAIELDTQMPEPLCVRALSLEERGKSEEAKAAIAAALELDAESWEANRTAAQLLFRIGEIECAAPLLEKAVAAAERDHTSAALLITCYSALGDRGGVRRSAELAVKGAESFLICDPLNGSAFASAARGFAALGEVDRAKKWVRKALAVDPGNLAMRYSLAATTASLLNDEAAAIEILEPFAEAARFEAHLRLLELDPSWAHIRWNVAFKVMLERARKGMRAFLPVS